MNMNVVEKTTWIPICCICHQVKSNELPSQNGFEKWMSLRSLVSSTRGNLAAPIRRSYSWR